ncbi:MAG: hypothetical protein OHK0040_11940 [bacterium]
MMAKGNHNVLYIGSDEHFFSTLKDFFTTEPVFFENFLKEQLSFSHLPKKEYSVIIVDGEYKNPLTLIETLRALYTDFFKPYVLLVAKMEQIKTLKSQVNIRNYPDDICLKDVNPKCIANQILFGCSNLLCNKDMICATKDIEKGDFKTRSYGSLIFDFFKEGFTGRLIVDSFSDRAVFSFLNGEPADIKFNRIQFTLGRMLLRRGIIDEETYLKSMEYMSEKNIRHGDALVEMGVISSSTVVEMIEQQYFEKLMYFFSKGAGNYLIVRGDVDFTIHPRVDVFHLIYSGVMQYSPVKYLTDKFLEHKNHFVALLENFTLHRQNIPFKDDELKVISLLESCPAFIEVLENTALDLSHLLKLFEILDICRMVQFEATKDKALEITKLTQPKMLELKNRIISDYMAIKEKNYYEVLGLNQDCSESEIKKRYLEKVKNYHPDTYSHMGLSKDLVNKVNEMFQLIQIAYQTLSNAESRKNYDAIISSSIVNEAMKKSSDIINAEISFKKGEFLLKRRNYKDAEGYFRTAVNLYDREPEYLVNLAVTLMFLDKKENDGKLTEAKSLLEKAIYINPYYDKAYHFLGILHKLTDNPKEALLYFKKAVEINPDNKEALMELKSLE